MSKDVLRGKRHCLRMLKRFDTSGEFPDRTRRSYAFENDAYENLPGEFKELIEFYRCHDLMRGKKQTTIYHEALNAVSFLCAMQQLGRARLDEIKERDVLSFFLSEDGQLIRGCSYKKNVAAVLKAGLHWREEPCHRILTCLPALRENRKIIQYLTEDETAKVREALRNRGTGFPSGTGLSAHCSCILACGGVTLRVCCQDPLTGTGNASISSSVRPMSLWNFPLLPRSATPSLITCIPKGRHPMTHIYFFRKCRHTARWQASPSGTLPCGSIRLPVSARTPETGKGHIFSVTMRPRICWNAGFHSQSSDGHWGILRRIPLSHT